MKKNLRKVISLLLAVTMLFSFTSVFVNAQEAEAADNSKLIAVTNAVNGLLNAVFKGFGSLFPNDFISVEEYYAGDSENFYEGNDTFLDEPSEDAEWYLGFGKQVSFLKIL